MVGCASVGGAPEAAPEPVWSPAGTWSFTTVAQGVTLGGSVVITEDANGYGGRIEPDPSSGMPSFPIQSIEMDGMEMTLTADAMGQYVTMLLMFDGDTYEGSWSMAGDGGEVSGVRR